MILIGTPEQASHRLFLTAHFLPPALGASRGKRADATTDQALQFAHEPVIAGRSSPKALPPRAADRLPRPLRLIHPTGLYANTEPDIKWQISIFPQPRTLGYAEAARTLADITPARGKALDKAIAAG